MRIIFVFVLQIILVTNILGQVIDKSFDVNLGLDSKHVKSIRNFKGNIVSIGTTESYFHDTQQLLILEITPSGEQISAKEIGEIGYHNFVLDVQENSCSQIAILGECRAPLNESSFYWIKILNHEGVCTNEKKLDLSLIPTEIHINGNNIDLFAIKNNELIWIKYNNDLSEEVFRKTIVSNKTTKILNATITSFKAEYVMMAEAQNNEGLKFLFIANFDSLGLLESAEIIESDFHSIGQLEASNDDFYYFTFHTYTNRDRENINIARINNRLEKSKSFNTKQIEQLGQDINRSLIIKDEEILLINNSTSHIRGSNTSKIQFIRIDSEFEQVGQEFYVNKNKFSEYIDNIIVIEDKLFGFGSLNDGSTFSSDLDFCRIDLDLAVNTPTDSSSIYIDDIDIKHQFSSEEFEDIIYSGLEQNVDVEILNNSKYRFENLVFKSIDGIQKEFSLGPNQSLNLRFPIQSKLEDFNWDYKLVKNDLILKEEAELVRVKELESAILEITDMEVKHAEDFLYKGDSIKFKISLKHSNLRDNDRVDLLVKGNEIVDLAKENIKVDNTSSSETIYTVTVTSLTQTNSEILEITFNGFLNDNIVVSKSYTIPLKNKEIDEESLAESGIEIKLTSRSNVQNDQISIDTEVDSDSLEPTITIALFSNVEEVVFKQSINLQYILISNDTIIEENIFYRLNGHEYQIVKGAKADEVKLSAIQNTNRTKKLSLDIVLDEGTNTLEVGYRAWNKDFLSSLVTTEFQNREKGNLHLFSIGISDEHWKDGLQYTQKDANTFKHLIEEQEGKFFNRVYTNLLVEDSQTTKAKILSSLNQLKRKKNSGLIRSQDVIVFFISTHGINDSNGKQYLTCSDYTSGLEDLSALDFVKDIYEPFEDFPCKKMYFIDACHSGAINEELLGRKGISDDAISYKGALQRLIASENLANVLLSCGPHEYSYEHQNWENSAFMESLERILSDKVLCSKLDINSDHLLSLAEIEYEFKQLTNDLVQKEFGKKTNQIPILTGDAEFKQIPFFAY